MLRVSITLISLLLFSNSFAKNSDVKNLVEQFYATQSFSQDKHDNCAPRGEGCFKVACDNVLSFECDDLDEVQAITKACRGVWGTACMKFSISKLSSFRYDHNEEMVELINNCNGIYDMSCPEYVCNKMGSWRCDDLDELKEVYRTCSGQDQ